MLLPSATARILAAMTAALFLSFGMGWAATATQPAGGVRIVPATVPAEQLDPAGWSAPSKLDEKDVRVAQSGKDAVVFVPSWWGSGLRPAQDCYWLIEVDYQDTAKLPVIFSAFTGLGLRRERTELHRFGGFGDNQWKTAQIPVGWDMLMLRPETKMAELAICSSEGDVAIAAIRIRPLAKEELSRAAEQYNAESREWLARVQQPKRSDLTIRQELGKSQAPDPAVVESKQVVVPFVRSYLDVIYIYSAPQKGETDQPLEATMALNEYEPAAFGVYANGKDLTNVRVRVEGLQHETNPKAMLTVEARTAEYSLQQSQRPQGQKPKLYAMSPLRLWPMYPTKIAKGESGWFWLTFHSDPQSTRPGLYKAKAVVTADQGQAVLDVRVRVLPIRLVDMNDTDLRMGGCVKGMVPRHELDEMLRHNHNQLNLWLAGVWPTILPKGKDDFDLEFTLMDDFMAQMKAAGLKSNVYFLGGNPYRFPVSMQLPKILSMEVLGLTDKEFVELQNKDKDNIPPRVVPLYKKWVEKFTAHAKAKGWPEQILTPFDEPAKWNQKRAGTGPWIKPQFIQGCELIRQGSPDTRIYISAHHTKATLPFLPCIDVFCTNVAEHDEALAPTVKKDGKTLWQYTNVFKGMPDLARYTFGFHYNRYNSRGSLCWAYNWFNNRFDITPDQNWGYAWTTPLDVIPGPYYEGLREAWDDRRYVETLKKIAKERDAAIDEFLDEIAEKARKVRGKGGQDAVDDFWEKSNRLEAMDEMRDEVAKKILEIQLTQAASSQPANLSASQPAKK